MKGITKAQKDIEGDQIQTEKHTAETPKYYKETVGHDQRTSHHLVLVSVR